VGIGAEPAGCVHGVGSLQSATQSYDGVEDLQEQADLLEKQRRWQGVRVLGVRWALSTGVGQTQACGVGGGDLGAVSQLPLDIWTEANPLRCAAFWTIWFQPLGGGVIVTDDLPVIVKVAESGHWAASVPVSCAALGGGVPCMSWAQTVAQGMAVGTG